VKRNTPLKRSPLRPKPRDPSKEARSKAKARKRARERYEKDFGGPHADWVRERGCEVCGCMIPAESHHDPYRSKGGTAKDLVGLCSCHHRTGKLARHNMSLARFNQTWGTDLRAAAARNWRESPHGEQANGQDARSY
jgi:hypothetical protein